MSAANTALLVIIMAPRTNFLANLMIPNADSANTTAAHLCWLITIVHTRATG